MKIYTRKGDLGHTSLIDGDIVNKHNLSVDAYGTIDELNSFLGLLKDYIKDDKIKDILNKIQIKLFSIGSILASGKNKNISEKVKIEKKDVEYIELEIDRLNKDLPVLEKRAGFHLGSKDIFLNITGGLKRNNNNRYI